MTDPAIAPEAPNVMETVRFLRRFADLMSNGQNSAWLLNAAIQLEALSARIAAASGEEELWRHKYESLAQDYDQLDSECEALRNDIGGHLDLSRSLLGDRDALADRLKARDAELGELNEMLNHAREELAAGSQAHEQAVAELRAKIDQEREALKTMVAARDEQLGQLQEALQSEREQSAQKLQAREAELAELQLGFAREREELQSRITSGESLIAMLRSDAERDSEWMKARIATLEAQRVELRSALDRIGNLQVAPASQDETERPDSNVQSEAGTRAPSHPDRNSTRQEGSVVVPTATLAHARAQFEYLAKESSRRGDVATQVMCELSAHTMEIALNEAERAEHSPAGRIALSILEPDRTASVVSDTV
jgi:chromosome segregation ATPase